MTGIRFGNAQGPSWPLSRLLRRRSHRSTLPPEFRGSSQPATTGVTQTPFTQKFGQFQIWTITFGSDANSSEIKSTMQSCASEAYYHAPSGDQLKEIFKNIAGQLSELRLVQ